MSAKGFEGAIRVGTTIANAEGSGTDEDGVQDINYGFANNAEELYEIGSRAAQEVKEGLIKITLSITAEYKPAAPTNWSAKAGVGAVTALTEYYVAIYPTGAVATNPEIRLKGKFNNHSISMSTDGVTTETITFVASEIAADAAFIG